MTLMYKMTLTGKRMMFLCSNDVVFFLSFRDDELFIVDFSTKLCISAIIATRKKIFQKVVCCTASVFFVLFLILESTLSLESPGGS